MLEKIYCVSCFTDNIYRRLVVLYTMLRSVYADDDNCQSRSDRNVTLVTVLLYSCSFVPLISSFLCCMLSKLFFYITLTSFLCICVCVVQWVLPSEHARACSVMRKDAVKTYAHCLPTVGNCIRLMTDAHFCSFAYIQVTRCLTVSHTV